MKQTSNSKHPFRYVSFAEQITKASMDTTKWQAAYTNLSNDQQTFLYIAIVKAIENDFGDSLEIFLMDINYKQNYLYSYSHLLYHRKIIFNAFMKHLRDEENSSLPTILDLAVAFGRDLREDFYVYLWDFFDVIVCILERSDELDVLEAAFRSLSIFFKLHSRELCRDLRPTFEKLLKLFTNRRGYLRRYAAEVSAFLVRKSSDISNLVKFLAVTGQKNDERVLDGISQLYFYTFKGVMRQFHSRSSNIFNAILNASLNIEEDEMKAVAFKIISLSMSRCINYTKKEYSSDLFNILLDKLENDLTDENLSYILRVITLWVNSKNGKVLLCPDTLLCSIEKCTLSERWIVNDATNETIFSICKRYGEDEKHSSIIVSILSAHLHKASLSNLAQVLAIFEKLIDVTSFYKYLLPVLGNYTEKLLESCSYPENSDVFSKILKFYSYSCIKRYQLEVNKDKNLRNFNVWTFRNLQKHILVSLRNLSVDRIVENEKELIYMLTILPMIQIDKEHGVLQDLVCLLKQFVENLSDKSELKISYLFAFYATNALLLISPSVFVALSFDDIIILIREDCINEYTLHIFYSILPNCGNYNEINRQDSFCLIGKAVMKLCGHHNSNVRQMVLEVLKMISLQHSTHGENDINRRLFEIILEAERTELSISSYRERVKLFRSLMYECHSKNHSAIFGNIAEEVCLRILIAQFYENFALYWPCLYEIIESYAYSMNVDKFWSIYLWFISHSTQEIGESLAEKKPEEKREQNDSLSKIVLDIPQPSFLSSLAPNYYTFRCQLFKLLSRFGKSVEKRSADLSSILYDIYHKEYQNSALLDEEFDSVEKIHDIPIADGEIDTYPVDSTKSPSIKGKTRKKRKLRKEKNKEKKSRNVSNLGNEKKLIKDSLITLLNVFSRFKYPKKLNPAQENIRILLYELLTSSSSGLQKVSLKCLFSYKNKHISPYRENLENLTSENNFSDELVHFMANTNDSIVNNDDRSELIPVVIRILYGKMNISNAQLAVSRRKIIFRFLSQCLAEEVDVFMNIIFAPIIPYAGEIEERENNLMETCGRVMQSFHSLTTLSISKLKGILTSIRHLINEVSISLNDYQQKFVYRLIIIISLINRLALRSDENNKLKPQGSLKNIKIIASRCIIQYFKQFDRREYERCEIEAFFKFIVEPQCNFKEKDEFICDVNIPLNVLRIFTSWSLASRLFYLLRFPIKLTDIRSDKCGHETALSLITLSLSSKSIKDSDKEFLLDSFLNLLDTNGYGQDISSIGEFSQENGLSEGLSMVLSQMPRLLRFILESLNAFISSTRKSKVTEKLIFILSRVSYFSKDAQIVDQLIKILFACLELKSIKSDVLIYSILTSISDLIVHATHYSDYFPQLISLQSSLKSQNSRQVLGKLLSRLSEKLLPIEPEVSKLLNLVVSLNLMDERKLDEPDHDKRHSAYIQLQKIWKCETYVNPTMIAMFAHNDHFTIIQVNDLALRAAALLDFQSLISYTSDHLLDEQKKKSLLDKHFIPLILGGLKSESENIRIDFIRVLSKLIDSFSSSSQLLPLSNLRSQDLDLDFFENLVHLQIHKRQRAFRRLTDSLIDNSVTIPSDVLIRFILPLLMPYAREFTSKTSALSDETLRLLSFIMGVTTWKRYFAMLQYYLRRVSKSDNKKAFIRIIVAIIDSFHFIVIDEKSSIDHGKNALSMDIDKSLHVCNDSIQIGESNNRAKKFINNSVPIDVIKNLLSQLKDCTIGKDLIAHRKARPGKYYEEDDIIERSPIALATVKLLFKMNGSFIADHLHGIIIKICDLLMSRSVNVRESARKTLLNVAQVIGGAYLPLIIRELKLSLRKGYQVHVMIYSIHALISSMQQQLTANDLDKCVTVIVEVCNTDLFGDVAEEKEVGTITMNVPEAKANRSYETYFLIGKYMKIDSAYCVIKPLRENFEKKANLKTIEKTREILRNFANGINLNESIEPLSLLVFLYRLFTEYLKSFNEEKTNHNDQFELDNIKPQQDCLLLEKEPARIGTITKVSDRSKSHVFIEFALNVLSAKLKSKKFENTNDEDCSRLNPFVSFLKSSFLLKHNKVIVYGLRCLISLLKFPLPALRQNIQFFIDRLFVFLSDYSSFGTNKNKASVFELNQLVFKAFTSVIKDAPSLVLTTERLRVLLSHMECDIMDSRRQATAFPLIKAIINRKLQDEKIVHLISSVSELAVNSEIPHIRVQCRQVLLQFIDKHPQSKNAKFYVKYFLKQLEYEYENGRISAIEMLNLLFENLPQRVIDNCSLIAFIKMAAQLVNDGSDSCRKLVALALKKLFDSISEVKFNEICYICRDWLKSSKEMNCCIAIKIFFELIQVKGESFFANFPNILPLICKRIDERYLEKCCEQTLCSVLDSLTLIFRILSEESFKKFINLQDIATITRNIENYSRNIDSLLIKSSASYFFGQIFACTGMQLLSLEDISPKDMAKWAFVQLRKAEFDAKLGDQLAKNLVFISKSFTVIDDVKWFCYRLSSICKFEIVRRPNDFRRRLVIFKLTAALLMHMEDKEAQSIVFEAFLPLLFREVQKKSPKSSEELEMLSSEVLIVFKSKMSDEEYLRRLQECQKFFAEKYEKVVRKRKEEAVIDPVKAALRKQKRNRTKVTSRKRKLDQLKPYRVIARKRRKISQI